MTGKIRDQGHGAAHPLMDDLVGRPHVVRDQGVKRIDRGKSRLGGFGEFCNDHGRRLSGALPIGPASCDIRDRREWRSRTQAAGA